MHQCLHGCKIYTGVKYARIQNMQGWKYICMNAKHAWVQNMHGCGQICMSERKAWVLNVHGCKVCMVAKYAQLRNMHCANSCISAKKHGAKYPNMRGCKVYMDGCKICMDAKYAWVQNTHWCEICIRANYELVRNMRQCTAQRKIRMGRKMEWCYSTFRCCNWCLMHQCNNILLLSSWCIGATSLSNESEILFSSRSHCCY